MADPAGLGDDLDLFDHARRVLARRLLAALADPGLRAGLIGPIAGRMAAAAPPQLHLDLPDGATAAVAAEEDGPAPEPDAASAPVAVLPLSEAAAPELLAARRRMLHRRGWRLALTGLSAGNLVLLAAPEALPTDLLRLRWSAELAEPALASALDRMDPARLVLTGCHRPAALAWGRARGIARFEGAEAEALLRRAPWAEAR